MRLLHREWEVVLDLAERYGWRPARGRDYARGGRFGEMEALRMAAALLRALPDIPDSHVHGSLNERRSLPTEKQALRHRKGEEKSNPLTYFSGSNRATLQQFVKLASHSFEVHPVLGFGGVF
jgi:hypothetical protein